MKYDKETQQYSLNGKNIKIYFPLDPNNEELRFNYYGLLGIDHPKNILSLDERKEIAEYMVDLWKEWSE